MGYPGAETSSKGTMSNGTQVDLKPIGLISQDVCHGWSDAINDWNNGKMNQFDTNCNPVGTEFPYSYVRKQEVEPYWAMARQYVLADHMFPSMFGPSYTAHLTIISGTTQLQGAPNALAVADYPSNSPWGCDAPPGTTTTTIDAQRNVNWSGGPFPCFTQFRTLADVLDAGKVSWRYYAPPLYGGGSLWTAFDNIKKVRYGPDWANVVSPSPTVLSDIAAGKLASVSWVMPDWPYSDHAGGGGLGPSWVAAVVNAVGQSNYWKNTAVVVLWDDWGGWYDPVSPPQLDYRGLGLRVPCLIVSAYAKRGVVSHTQYEFGSVLKFVEETFGLPTIGSTAQGYTDARATSISDSFDFNKPPHAFRAIPAPYPASYFPALRPSMHVPDDI